MTTTTTYRPAAPTGRAGFGQLVRAEWTKLRSVRRWVLGLGSAILLTLLISLLTASGSGSDLNQHPDELGPIGPDGQRVRDELHFVHQPLTGDGSITVRVASQENSHEWARAGVMVRESTEPGSQYAAVLVTPSHGVRMQADFTTDLAGTDGSAPRWLRLTRSGTAVTGYESGDGTTWSEVGTVDLGGLPQMVQVGFFVNSPDEVVTDRSVGGSSSGQRATSGSAQFDNVRVEPVEPQPTAPWRSEDTSKGFVEGGELSQEGGDFTVTGSGDLAVKLPDSDVTQLSLFGVLLGQLAVAVVAVLFVTSEYKRGMIRTTLAASPREGRVLAAKAVVIGGVAFAVGLVASLAAFFVTQPVLRGNGFGPPAYPIPSLADWPVQRAVLGAAALLALVAVFSLGVGTILRGGAGAITAVLLILLPPLILPGILPLAVEQWVVRTTPAAGFSVLQTVEQDYDTAHAPWNMLAPGAGLSILAAYAAASLAIAYWLLRRRDA